jgi:hypothetical protein
LLDDPMNYEPFKIGFWHPFGPHGGETAEQIIDRKRKEIEVNGWTLWSFQYRRLEVLKEWFRQLSISGVPSPVVYCSHSPGAKDPAGVEGQVKTADCQAYRFVNQTEWQPLPLGVGVPHPFRRNKSQASAFVIKGIVHPITSSEATLVEWLSKFKEQWQWQQNRVPTRGEYLIRPGGKNLMRQAVAMLELRPPYLAEVRQ